MSDDSRRAIPGLAPRKVSPKTMIASNRPAPPVEPAPSEAIEGALTASERPTVAPEAPRRSTAPRKPATALKSEQGRVNTYIDADTRSRVVATYKATAHLEGDESFSAFVETALLNEAIRREQLHNDGEQFAASGKLQRGRPMRG